MVSNIKNYDGLVNLDINIEKAEIILEKAQNNEIERDDIDLTIGLKIGALGI